MNKAILTGRLATDVDLRYTTGENAKAQARFTVAVSRTTKNADGNYEADFIRCVAWQNHAEFINKFFHKGDMIAIDGHIRTGSYKNKDGATVYTTEVWVDHPEFCGSKGSGNGGNGGSSNNSYSNQQRTQSSQRGSETWMNVPSGDDEEMPF